MVSPATGGPTDGWASFRLARSAPALLLAIVLFLLVASVIAMAQLVAHDRRLDASVSYEVNYSGLRLTMELRDLVHALDVAVRLPSAEADAAARQRYDIAWNRFSVLLARTDDMTPDGVSIVDGRFSVLEADYQALAAAVDGLPTATAQARAGLLARIREIEDGTRVANGMALQERAALVKERRESLRWLTLLVGCLLVLLVLAVTALCVALYRLWRVTERSRAELEATTRDLASARDAVTESEARFRDFAGSTADWFWETDLEQRFTYFSGEAAAFGSWGERFRDSLGRRRQEVIGPLGPAPDPIPLIRDFMDRGQPFETLEFSLPDPESGEAWISLSGVPVRDESGRVVLYRGAGRFVTERKRAERALQQSIERFELAVRGSSAGIWDWDVQTGRVHYTARFRELLGFDDADGDEDLGFLESRLHPDDRDTVMSALHAHLSARLPFDRVCRFLSRDGRELWFRVVGQAIWDEAGRPSRMCGSILDVTEHRRTEDLLRQSQKMEAVGNLTGGIAHDFNNMLTVVIGNLDLLVDEVGDRPAVREAVELTKRAAESGAELTGRLLAFARRQTRQPRRVAVNELVQGMGRLLDRTLGPDIGLDLRLAADLWPVVIDPGQLEAAVVNLAVNARDAMPEGGRLVVVTENVSVSAAMASDEPDLVPGDYVRLTVTDTGTGIAPDHQERVFEPFFTTKQVGEGTGLGLAMVFGFLKQSGGHVTLASRPGHGATFHLYLPSDPSVVDVVPVKPQIAGLCRAAAEGRILLVDDDDAVRQVTARQLRTLGCTVIEARSGSEALARLTEDDDGFDLLFSDIRMPGMSGIELATEARARRADQRILLMSGYADGAQRAGSARLGDVGTLLKPFQRGALVEALNALFGS